MTTLSPVERAKKLVGRKAEPTPEEVQAERTRAALLEVAVEQQWPSVSVAAATHGQLLPLGGLPEGVPDPPLFNRSSPTVAAAKAKAKALAERFGQFDADMADALETVDPERVLTLRREREQVSVELWAAERDAAAAHAAHLDSELSRLTGYLPAYAASLDGVRAELRELHGKERALVVALESINGSLARLAALDEQVDRDMRKLRRGPNDPALAASRTEGWGRR